MSVEPFFVEYLTKNKNTSIIILYEWASELLSNEDKQISEITLHGLGVSSFTKMYLVREGETNQTLLRFN